jgi:hypothetical protein
MRALRRPCPPEASRRRCPRPDGAAEQTPVAERPRVALCSSASSVRLHQPLALALARAARLGRIAALALCGVLLAPGPAVAQPTPVAEPVPVAIDRVAVRFTAPETGGIDRPEFIFERELAFEARLEALADGGFRVSAEEPYADRHVRAALERHMAEVLLARLEITPDPTPREVAARTRAAQLTLSQQVGGDTALEQASHAEGMSPAELSRLLVRRARASLYLDRMVATMLTPSDTELRIVHRTTRTPFSGAEYEEVAPMLQRWYVAQRLNAAVRAFYEGARSRLQVTELLAGGPARKDAGDR